MSAYTTDHMESHKSLLEVSRTEKQLFPMMYSKGILHGDVLKVYREVRTGYERILLYSDQMGELQEVEYLLWKLHYKHIVEFRKRMEQQSINIDDIKSSEPENIDSQSNSDCHLGGFTLFLTDAAKFYSGLIIQLRGNCGLPKEIFLDVEDGISLSIELTKQHKCQFTCHRLLVCLGDLARYSEILKSPGAREWFVSARYYLEATRAWSDSGNPHNQLALLATYVGDAFLALYHCVRSFSIKEPFPDAWRNLVLLFKESFSTQFPSSYGDASFDYSNPSKRSFPMNKSSDQDLSPNLNNLDLSPDQTGLWSAVIRIISFFIVRSSLEEFPRTFTGTLSSLEALLAIDDKELSTVMESYRLINSFGEGPHRAIQLVSTFIFLMHILIDIPKMKDSLNRDKKTQTEYTRLAFVVVFVCMGRLIERCLQHSLVNCPLLPAVLVFVEWFVGAFDEADACAADERVVNAMSYFLGALSDLLNKLGQNDIVFPYNGNALWEDHLLRGFRPLAHVHKLLNFSMHQEHLEESYKIRIHRIFIAAVGIVDRSKSSRVRISYDEDDRLFSTTAKYLKQLEVVNVDAVSCSSTEEEEQHFDQPNRSMINEDKVSPGETELMTTEDEEEVILFKPIKRHNSAPVCIPNSMNDSVCTAVTGIPRTLLDESLCRATIFSNTQQWGENDSFSFSSSVSNSRDNLPFEPQEPIWTELMPHTARPPSLSSWVLGRGISNLEKEMKGKEYNKNKLIPIDEMTSISLWDKTQGTENVKEHISSFADERPPYVAPLPSAPYLPDDVTWSRTNPLVSTENTNMVRTEEDGILGSAPSPAYTNCILNRTPIGFPSRVSNLMDGCPPYIGMSSSEWLYHYRNGQQVESLTNHLSPFAYNPPLLENFQANQVCRLDLCDQWGNRLASNPSVYLGIPQLFPHSTLVYDEPEQEQVRDKFFIGHQRSFPYCVGMEIRSEQPPLLQYLNDREWQLHHELHPRSPSAFIGN